jgi:hypothetical protein
MTDRLLYAATALALMAVFALDPNFFENLSRAFTGAEFVSLDPWTAGAVVIFLALAAISLFWEWRR